MGNRTISNGEDSGRTRSFNLIDEGWIPVVDFCGKARLVGLKELFTDAERLADLAVGTLERIALVRLLICIAQRALEVVTDGPEDYDDWIEARKKIVPAVLTYFGQWHDRFDLYGDDPFLQVKNLKTTSKSGDSNKTDKLDFGLSSGNNSTLFDQFAEEEGRIHSDAWLTIYLMVYQLFSPGGRIGVAEWNGKPTEGNGSSNSAPGVEGGMLFSLLMGSSLLDTIFGNTLPLEIAGKIIGKPVWEYDLNRLSENDKKRIVSSYYGRLVPLARTVRLGENGRDMILANGLSYPQLPDSRETMASVVTVKSKKKEEWKYVRTDPLRHPWRNLHSILSLNKRNAKDIRSGAYFLQSIPHLLTKRVGRSFILWTGGILANKAKIVDTASWTFPFNEKSIDEEILRQYEYGVQLAEAAQYRLAKAVEKYSKDLMYDTVKKGFREFFALVEQAKTLFWTALDREYEILMKCAENSDQPQNRADPLRAWKDVLQKEMTLAYEQTCPHRTARQLQAYAIGKVKLYLPKNEASDDKKSKKSGKSTRKAKKIT